jgi:hypothetical protein
MHARTAAVSLVLLLGLLAVPAARGETQWYKGVTHVHSLWSDGDSAPEAIAAWYYDRGYHFMCFSEHNSLQEGERFVRIAADSKFKPEHLVQIVERFGETWPEIHEEADGTRRMRLKTHEELGARFNEAGRFLLVPAEEITTFGSGPHVNGINLYEPIKPIRAGDITKIVQAYIDAVREQSERLGKPMFAHVNHLNFADGVTSEELIGVRGLEFFEVYNGHSSVHSWGRPSKGMPSGDRHWDIIQSVKQLNEPDFTLYGVATDDSHEYHEWGVGKTNPGRGWVMVRSEKLDGDALAAAMKRGDFYASTGVTLKDVRHDGKSLAFDIAGEEGVTYVTQFIGTKRGFDATSKPALDAEGNPFPRGTREYSESVGEVLHETTELNPSYTFSGEELYVRARVVSDKLQPNPHEEGDYEMAWVQPVVVRPASE